MDMVSHSFKRNEKKLNRKLSAFTVFLYERFCYTQTLYVSMCVQSYALAIRVVSCVIKTYIIRNDAWNGSIIERCKHK